MRVIDPKVLQEHSQHRTHKHKKKRRSHAFSVTVIMVLAVYVVASLAMPLPLLQAEPTTVRVQASTPVSIPWPLYGQAAVGAVGYGLLAEHGQQTQLPIASVAKVMTAVAVLKVKPILPGGTGETITITAEDEAIYNQYFAEGQSVVPVTAGDELTEYQALQALMLPSANNMAEILVRWAFGSMDNYVKFVNPFTKTLGMTSTVIADASGYNPSTMSTASDLTKLAEIAMNNPVLAEIVGQAQADLPSAGTVYNVNNFLGTNDIVGIKTGTTDEAGGCYMFAAKRKVSADHTVTVVGVVIGASSRIEAMNDSLPIIDETFKGFSITQPVQTEQIVGTITQTNGPQVDIKVRQGVSVLTWAGQTPTVSLNTKTLGRHINAGDDVGTLTVHVGNLDYTTTLMASDTIKSQSLLWRLRHAGGYI